MALHLPQDLLAGTATAHATWPPLLDGGTDPFLQVMNYSSHGRVSQSADPSRRDECIWHVSLVPQVKILGGGVALKHLNEGPNDAIGIMVRKQVCASQQSRALVDQHQGVAGLIGP
ncbi:MULTISPECIES: hypothetical protein [Stenotrophomonas]|uniref:hypothetical protein n=1 Tax=Stenotrophomonas TaxID=40323 RepID=UPI00128E0526|nr:hypothetical protein [Stenotrophomonas sp. BIO128-Bstrain]WIA62612.1 hypothetical protein POS15_05145 [Stenotrophomonas sp. BIO128-Bstrain]